MCDSKNQKKQIQTRNEFSIDAQPGNIEKTFFFDEAKSDFKIILKNNYLFISVQERA